MIIKFEYVSVGIKFDNKQYQQNIKRNCNEDKVESLIHLK